MANTGSYSMCMRGTWVQVNKGDDYQQATTRLRILPDMPQNARSIFDSETTSI
jgi:hypothetical protein